MLNRDEASRQLEQFLDPDWHRAAIARCEASDSKAAATGLLLVTMAQRYQSSGTMELESLDACRTLDDLSTQERVEVFVFVHPQLAAELSSWWDWAAGEARRARFGSDVVAFAGHRGETLEYRAFRLMVYVSSLVPYPRDIVWVATWSSHIRGVDLDHLLAAVMDGDGDSAVAVYEVLIASIRGEHEIGQPNRTTFRALLRANRPEGWEQVALLLVAAQREEGLRQVILESSSYGGGEALLKMIDTVLEHDLLRFSATIQCAGRWLGIGFQASEKSEIDLLLREFMKLLIDSNRRIGGLTSSDPLVCHLSLMATRRVDALEAFDALKESLNPGSAADRQRAVHLLPLLDLPQVLPFLFELFDDADLLVAGQAFNEVLEMAFHPYLGPGVESDSVPLMTVVRLINRLPKRLDLGLSVRGPVPQCLDRQSAVLAMLGWRQDHPVDLALPYVDDLDVDGRARFVLECQKEDEVSVEVRRVLMRLASDRSGSVQALALGTLEKLAITNSEAEALEPLLKRKAMGPREAVVSLLVTLSPPDRLSSAERLWQTRNSQQRDAACELLAGLEDSLASRLRSSWMAEATSHQSALLGSSDRRTEVERLHDPANRSPRRQPQNAGAPRALASDELSELIHQLDDLVERHRNMEVEVQTGGGATMMLLADVNSLYHPLMFGHGGSRRRGTFDEPKMFLEDIFRAWWAERDVSRWPDSSDVVGRAALASSLIFFPRTTDSERQKKKQQALIETFGYSPRLIRHWVVVNHVLSYLAAETSSARFIEELLSTVEYEASLVDEASFEPDPTRPAYLFHEDERETLAGSPWYHMLHSLVARDEVEFSAPQLERLWKFHCWLSEPVDGAARRRIPLWLLVRCRQSGLANDEDIYDYLLEQGGGHLATGTLLDRSRFVEQNPSLVPFVDRLRDAIVSDELARGDLPTDTSEKVVQISSAEGADLAMTALNRLGTLSLSSGYTWGTDKKGTLSHLIRVSFPSSDDDASTLSSAVSRHGIREQRLVEFGVYAPQWASLVEQVLGWPGFEEAVWWIHAHTKSIDWSVGYELRATWAAMSAERTELSGEDLVDGAVDVRWFRRVQDKLGARRWDKVYEAGKYASSGTGHRRAQIFADAMRGKLSEVEMVERIQTKRHQDTVRGLGLLPLPKGPKAKPKALLRRYQTVREFERGASKFGQQRQRSELAAARIGLDNLARTAGFSDPLRFGWAMEMEELSDLADGPISVTVDDVTVVLGVDGEGHANLGVDRSGKRLKSVPAKMRKNKQIAALSERKTALVKQLSRVRKSLERSLVAGEEFSREDLLSLQRHPIVAPMLRTLVLIDEAQSLHRLDSGSFLDIAVNVAEPVGLLRIAHPFDLLESGEWSRWQRWCLENEIRQPFKQIYRELYIPTPTEGGTTTASSRYNGHQVQPRQALALLANRSWNVDYGNIVVSRVFHEADIVARLDLSDGFLTPAEVEAPVIQDVHFTRRSDWKSMALSSVPPRVFSEAMRDMDLVVSVAHAGGVDPESSASTIEMRSALVRETVRLLDLNNAEIIGNHVVISGTLGEYSLHLGSGVVHRRPGGHICIIPVHAQRRGRVFLPFVDDDPRTAEIMSKLLLLCRDDKIRDPTILQQLRR